MSEDTASTANKPKLKARVRFVRCFLIAVAIVALPTSGVAYFNIYLPQGKGPAGPNVPSEPFRHIWSEQKVLLLGIGDSITDGFGARIGFSYFDRLIKNPAGDSPDMLGKNMSLVFPNLESRKIAVSGSNSFDHISKIRALQPQPPDVLGIVVITTGGNDLIHNYGHKPPVEGAMYGATLEQAKPWIDNFRKRLDEMITQLKEKLPGGCQIFLATIYDPSDGTGDSIAWLTGLPAWPDGEKILDAYNKILADCATKYDYVHQVDMRAAFLGHGIHCRKFWIKSYRWGDPTYWYYLNIEDPSERGYDAVRRLFLNEMIKVFAGKNGS